MTTDLVVVLPGIMGSTLRADGKLVWAPSAGAVLRAIRTFGRSITTLTLPAGIGDDHPGDGVEPAGLMPDLHVLPGLWTPVRGYDQLVRKLRGLGCRDVTPDPDAPPGNLLLAPYDWRLSNRYNGKRLGTLVEPALARWRAQGGEYADAKVVFVCHSMGGLVARWYIERCGGAEITRKLVTLGTPYRGAVKALEQLVNGIRPGIGPLAFQLTGFARSMPSLHQLLPEYACIEHDGDLVKTTETTIPELDSGMVADAMAFHTALRTAEAARPAGLADIHALLGARQPTSTTAAITGGRVVAKETYRGENRYGDGTVPNVGAARADVPLDSNTLHHVADMHGNLQCTKAVFTMLTELITNQPVVVRGPGDVRLRLSVPDLIVTGEDLTVRVDLDGEVRRAVTITATHEDGRQPVIRTPRVHDQRVTTTLSGLRPGAYTIVASGPPPVAPVTAGTLVWDGS